MEDDDGRRKAGIGEVEAESEAVSAGIPRARKKALDLKLAFDFKTLITDRRIAELESRLGAKLGTYPN